GQQAVIDVLNRVRQPFNLSDAQLAAAEAAVRDTEYTSLCKAENARLRDWMRSQLEKIGVPTDKSHTNFVLARFAGADEANACDAHLKSRGIIVRKVAGYGLPQALRISVGDEEACTRVIAAIRDFKTESSV
ncbi:MAG: aminotransferase class I/II-fold pyridoxal phosphate-dependent enzyme, partial [Pseudomonadota bacterium]